jgi:hypothetical protein
LQIAALQRIFFEFMGRQETPTGRMVTMMTTTMTARLFFLPLAFLVSVGSGFTTQPQQPFSLIQRSAASWSIRMREANTGTRSAAPFASLPRQLRASLSVETSSDVSTENMPELGPDGLYHIQTEDQHK